jgi:hypothetical protein
MSSSILRAFKFILIVSECLNNDFLTRNLRSRVVNKTTGCRSLLLKKRKSIGFLSLPSVGVGVDAVRLVEPVVEEVKVNKQMLADANKLMADARTVRV